MKYLSLFSGIGGGDLSMQYLLGMRCIGYVEWDEYCQKVIAQRQKDGFLDTAPIFGDIRAFLDSGYASSYQGMVDLVTAGFPCQPHSTAGKRRGAADERDMWPTTAEVIGAVRPRYVFLENVPGIIQGRDSYAWRVITDLSALGYDSRWCVLGARDVGAPHRRNRWWCLVHRSDIRCDRLPIVPGVTSESAAERRLSQPQRGMRRVDDADTGIGGSQDAARWDVQTWAEDSGERVAYTKSKREWSESAFSRERVCLEYSCDNVAHNNSLRHMEREFEPSRSNQYAQRRDGDDAEAIPGVDDAAGTGWRSERSSAIISTARARRNTAGTGQRIVDDSECAGLEGWDKSAGSADKFLAWPPGPSERDRWAAVLRDYPELAPALSREEEIECNLRRGIDGVSNRLERLKALGNAQVALCAATAWRILNDLHR